MPVTGSSTGNQVYTVQNTNYWMAAMAAEPLVFLSNHHMITLLLLSSQMSVIMEGCFVTLYLAPSF